MAESGVRSMMAWLRSLDHAPADAHEALALAVHGLLVAHGFRPADQADAAGQQQHPEQQTQQQAQQEVLLPRSRLPGQWGTAGYGGRYRHNRSQLTFDVRAVAVGPRLVVHATTVEDDDTLHTLELRVDRFVRWEQPTSTTTSPATPPTASTSPGAGGVPETATTTATTTTTTTATSSEDNLTVTDSTNAWVDNAFQNELDLATLVQVNVAHRLVPDAAKDGYEAAAEAGTLPSSQGASSAGAGGAAGAGARRPPPPARGPYPDYDHDADDPLRIGPPMHPGRNPYGIPARFPGEGVFGGDDFLNPSPYGLGHDDLVAPGLPGRRGGPGFGGGFGGEGGGNLMGPRHPGFGGGRGDGRFGAGPRVPGARFDPFGPPDPYAGYGPGAGRGEPPQGGNRGGRPLGPDRGDPDNDIERPAPPDNEHGVPEGPPPDMYW